MPSPVSADVTAAVSTVQVTSSMGGAGQALSAAPSSSIQIANDQYAGNAPVQYKVGSNAWATLQPSMSVQLAVDLSATTVLLRKGSTTAASIPVTLTVNTVASVAPSGGVPIALGAGGALGPYATVAALQTASPAAANAGKHASVGAAAPYIDYVSDGSVWKYSGGPVAPFLGHVGTRCVLPTAQLAGPNYLRSLDTDVSTTDFDTLIGGWAFWRLNSGNESYGTGTTTFTGYCEYPAGSGNFYLAEEVKANGNSPITVNLTAPDKTCYLTFKVPNGRKGVPYRWWMMQDAPSGGTIFWRQGQIIDQIWPSGQGMDGPSNGARPAVLATYGTNFSEYSFPPATTIALTTVPSAIVFNDSREECNSEGARPPFYVNGIVGPSISMAGAGMGVSRVGASGMSLSQLLSGNAYAQRVLLARWFTDVFLELGVNDMVGQARTPAQFQADCLTFKALFLGKRMGQCTIFPQPNTSDGFATIANQTGNSASSIRISGANERIRARSTGADWVLDTADKVDPYRLGKVPVDRNKNLTVRASTAQFTASIANTYVMTVTAVASGTININDPLTDSLTLTADQKLTGNVVLEQLTGTTGGVGTYRVSRNNVITSRTMYVGGYAMTDGFHQTRDLSEQVMAQQVPDVVANMTPRPLVVT